MSHKLKSILGAALALVSLLVVPQVALAEVTDQTRIINRAATTVERLRNGERYSDNLNALLAKAQGVLIIPDLVKGGFILGGEYGSGVMLVRDHRGWSAPAFYGVASGSVGLQIGLQTAETMFVIMTEKGLNAVMNNRFKAGADAGVALFHVGASTEAALTTNVGADIYAYSRSAGLYGGLTLEGSGIVPKDSWNAAYYPNSPTPADILLKRVVDNPQARRLQDVLSR